MSAIDYTQKLDVAERDFLGFLKELLGMRGNDLAVFGSRLKNYVAENRIAVPVYHGNAAKPADVYDLVKALYRKKVPYLMELYDKHKEEQAEHWKDPEEAPIVLTTRRLPAATTGAPSAPPSEEPVRVHQVPKRYQFNGDRRNPSRSLADPFEVRPAKEPPPDEFTLSDARKAVENATDTLRSQRHSKDINVRFTRTGLTLRTGAHEQRMPPDIRASCHYKYKKK